MGIPAIRPVMEDEPVRGKALFPKEGGNLIGRSTVSRPVPPSG